MIFTGTLLFVCALLAFALSAVCGGGASFILIPLLGLMLPGAQIPAALSIGTTSSSMSRIVAFYKNIRWEIVVWFVPPALPAVWLGAWLLTYINPLYLELVLGIFLLSNLTMMFKSRPQENATSKMPKLMLSIIGLTAGFVSGLTGAVGLLFNRFYLRYGLTKDEIVATRAANELLLHVIKLVLYGFFGLLTAKVWGYGLLIALAAVLSSLLIKKVLPYISELLFQRVGYAAMVISGAAMFMNASVNLANQNNLGISYQSEEDGIETKMQWRQTTFNIDFEFDNGELELEHEIEWDDLPDDKKTFVRQISTGADKLILEEVYAFHEHSYEAYVYKDGKIAKYDFD